jgi:hypothetical protein
MFRLYVYSIIPYYTYTANIFYVCISTGNAFVRTKASTLQLYNALITMQKTSCIYIFFLKMSCFHPQLFNRDNTWMLQSVACFFRGLASVSLVFCKYLQSASRFIVGALRPLAPPGYVPGHHHIFPPVSNLLVCHSLALPFLWLLVRHVVLLTTKIMYPYS